MYAAATITRSIKRVLIRALRARPFSNKLSLGKFSFEPYIQALKEAFDDCIADPNFIHAKPDSIKIDVNKMRLQAIRIELPATECLHLHSIEILDAKGTPLPLAKLKTKVTASSYYGNSKERIRLGQLFDTQGEHIWAIHTNRENNPWIEVTLPKAKLASAIIINNRQDSHAMRAVGLKVSASTDGKYFEDVFDLGGIDDFKVKARQIAKRFNLYKFEYAAAVHEFTTLVIQGKDLQANQPYRHVPSVNQKSLRDAINKIVLEERGIEWTSHGLRRSFRFWGNDEKRAFIRFSMQVVKDLTDLSPDVCLGYGSVLAIVRDKDLIPHDDDMDIIIAFTSRQATTLRRALAMVKNHLDPKGYNVGGDFFNYWHVSRDGFKVDVFVGIYEADNTIGWYPYKRGALKQAELFPPKKANLLGVSCTIPCKPERYLEVIYGPNWRKPDPGWHPDWGAYKASYRDILGK